LAYSGTGISAKIHRNPGGRTKIGTEGYSAKHSGRKAQNGVPNHRSEKKPSKKEEKLVFHEGNGKRRTRKSTGGKRRGEGCSVKHAGGKSDRERVGEEKQDRHGNEIGGRDLLKKRRNKQEVTGFTQIEAGPATEVVKKKRVQKKGGGGN